MKYQFKEGDGLDPKATPSEKREIWELMIKNYHCAQPTYCYGDKTDFVFMFWDTKTGIVWGSCNLSEIREFYSFQDLKNLILYGDNGNIMENYEIY